MVGRVRGRGKKAEKDGARVFCEVRLPQTRRILRLFFPSVASFVLRLLLFSPPPPSPFSLSLFPFFLLPSDARLPSRCSYVQLASRLCTEERKTWVLIRAHCGCGSSRRYFMANRLPSRASSLPDTHAYLFLSMELSENLCAINFSTDSFKNHEPIIPSHRLGYPDKLRGCWVQI